mmetsp:Transcript_26755/g.39715  ORF Transcript_26755/g.39715 Transcript_26755/m.39715 type:complete len:212 (-) Transcript_26755:146-781(-)
MSFPSFKRKTLKGTDSKKKKKSLHVHFSDNCEVVLIPMRSEYIEEGPSLWWNRDDVHRFKHNFRMEKRKVKQELAVQSLQFSWILLVTNSHRRKSFMADKLSKIAPTNTTFKACLFRDLETVLMHLPESFTAVIIDSSCSDIDDGSSPHFYRNAAKLARALCTSKTSVTVFVDCDKNTAPAHITSRDHVNNVNGAHTGRCVLNRSSVVSNF